MVVTTSELTALLGVLVPFVIAVFGGIGAWALRLVIRAVDKVEAANKERLERLEGVDETLRKVQEENAADRAARAEKDAETAASLQELRGIVLDQKELIEDMTPVVIWVRDGANPPVPSITWRISQYLERKLHQND